MSDAAIVELAPMVGIAAACRALGQARATLYRRRRPPGLRLVPAPRPRPARSLNDEERAGVLDLLRSPRFVDLAPAQVYATLLDEGTYLASERTMYRILAANGEVRERRDQLRHPSYTRYLLTTLGRQLVLFCTRLYSRALCPGLGQLQSSRSTSPLAIAWRRFDREAATLVENLSLTA
jgi:hypothetical protein